MSNYLRWLLEWATYPLRALLYAPARILSGSRRLAGLSLPFQVALLTLFVLVLSVVVTVILFCRMQNVTFRQAKLNYEFWVITSVLVLLIPFVLYKALSLWLEGPSSPYPEIDRAWNAGIRELQRKGLDLRQIPLFLVVGSASEQQERAIFQTAGTEFLVTGVPQGDASLHWYAQQDAIYVVASQTSCLSGLGRNGPSAPESRSPGQGTPGVTPPAVDLRQTMPVGGMSRPMAPEPSEASAPVRPQDQAPSSPQKSNDMRGTIMDPSMFRSDPGGRPAPVSNIPTDRNFFVETRKQFAWLCRLIRRSRLPYSPINGVLALLSFGKVQSGQPGVRNALGDALRYDLEQVLASLMIRCPVTVLVTDMEEEPGFREFIKRMIRSQGPEYVKKYRFGRSFPLAIPATPERVQRLAAHLGSAFEGWIYGFFHDEESILRSAGNTSLYAFLSKIRQSVRNLGEIFGGFSRLQPKAIGDAVSSPEVIFFAGCYFAGNGKTDELQVFIKPVLEKPIEQQEELEWTAAALREDHRYQWLGLMVSAVDTVLFFSFVAVGVLWWMGYKPSWF